MSYLGTYAYKVKMNVFVVSLNTVYIDHPANWDKKVLVLN